MERFLTGKVEELGTPVLEWMVHVIMCDWSQTISSNRTVITRLSQVFRWTSIEWAGWVEDKGRESCGVPEWSLIKRECNLVIFISLLSATGVSRVFISSVGV